MTTYKSLCWEKYDDLNTTPEHISRFLSEAQHGSIFQNPRWHIHTEENANRYMVIAALRQGVPVFASLIRKIRVPGSRLFVGTVERGPVFDDFQLAIGTWDAYETQLVRAGFCAIEIHPFWQRAEAQPLTVYLKRHGYLFSPKGRHTETLTLDLTPSEEVIFNSMTSSRRRQIRKAIRIGIDVRPARNREEMEKFWKLYRDMCLSKGIHFLSRRRFESMWRFSTMFPSDCVCLLGWLNGELVGGNIILRHSGIAEYTRGGGSIRIDNSIPKTDLIHWESILWAKRVGASIYDFGGFKPDAEKGTAVWGVNRFKLEFTQTRVQLLEPMEKVFNAKVYLIYNFLKKTKKSVLAHLPVRLAN